MECRRADPRAGSAWAVRAGAALLRLHHPPHLPLLPEVSIAAQQRCVLCLGICGAAREGLAWTAVRREAIPQHGLGSVLHAAAEGRAPLLCVSLAVQDAGESVFVFADSLAGGEQSRAAA